MKPIGNLGKMGVLLMKIKSDSIDEEYEIRDADDHLTCTCIGFQTSKRRPKTCKHIRRYFVLGILKNIYDWNLANEEFPPAEKLDLLHEAKEIERLFRKEV